MTQPPLHHYRFCLPFRAVHIQCLNDEQEEIKNAYASGFIVKENGQLFLYTCWHVATGYDMHKIKTGNNLPDRSIFRVTLQDCQQPQPGLNVVGGKQSFEIQLYTEKDGKKIPAWFQDMKDLPCFELNNINIKVPSWHDVIKLHIPHDICVSDMQILSDDDISMNSPMIGDKLYIVGFPYGYSALGLEQPTPIVMTRFLAANSVVERTTMDRLMDGPCTHGMSGGPVFVETNNALFLTGIYKGSIYPDYKLDQKNKETTQLGLYCNMIMWWKDVNKVK